MNTKINNAKTTFFESKEHYLNFRKAWAKSFNDPTIRPTLTPAHFLLYALLRERDATSGFTPLIRENKINNSYRKDPWIALFDAYDKLGFWVRLASEPDVKMYSYELGANVTKGDRVKYFLRPFGGEVSVETFAKMKDHIPDWSAIKETLAKAA